MKRFISVFLFVCILCTIVSSNVFAMDEAESKSIMSIYEQAEAFAAAKGISIVPISTPTDEKSEEIPFPNKDLDKIHKDYKKDIRSDNTFVVTGGSSADNAQSISPNTYTYDSISSAGAVDWFVFKTSPGSGAYNIFTTGSTDTYGEIYKKNIFGSLELIDQDDDDGNNTNFYLADGLSGNTNYYIKVRHFSSTGTGSYTLRVEENIDTLYAPNGGSWTWYDADPDPDGAFFNIDKLVYLTADEAEAYYIMVSRDNFREVRDEILGLSFNAAVAYVISVYKVTLAVAEFIVGEAADFVFPDLTDLELDSIANAGNLNDSTGQMLNGIKIISLTSYSSMGTPVMMNTYESWNSSNIYGEARYRGTFDTSDKTPIWR